MKTTMRTARIGVALVAALLAMTTLATTTAEPVLAQDGKNDGARVAEKTPEQKALEAVGRDFAAKNVSSLMARVPADKKKKINLVMGDADGRKSREQARQVLEQWFEKRRVVTVKLKSSQGLVGNFKLEFRRVKEDELRSRVLVVRLRGSEEDGFQIAALEIRER